LTPRNPGGSALALSGHDPAPAGDPAACTVLIVDDSLVARTVIAGIVERSGRFAVAGAVGSVAAALDFLERDRVDIIVLDIAMPGIDGVSALPKLIAVAQGARIVVVSSTAAAGAAVTVRALTLGAADTLAKPETGALSGVFASQLLDRLDRLSGSVALPSSAPVPAAAATGDLPVPLSTGDDYDIVAIGASTGGIHAIGQLLRAIPTSFRLPILITQHLPASFMPYFAAQLAVLAGRPCEVATDRLRIRPGGIVVAPGDGHLRCVSLGDGHAAVRLSHEPQSSGCLPSVDPMLTSLAGVYGDRLLAIVLSGMGRDGAEGAGAVRAAGGCIVVQDQASSVVWGMPGTIASLGLADAILPPDQIGQLTASRRRP
jgi:two-component system chemotaxis response regulator CheB